jgi:hypothetical protein
MRKNILEDVTKDELRVMRVLFMREFRSVEVAAGVRAFIFGKGAVTFDDVIDGVKSGRFVEHCVEAHLSQARAIIKTLNEPEVPPFDHKVFNQVCHHDWNFENDTCRRCGAKYRWEE